MARITVAEHAGACYGVERALKIALECAEDTTGAVHTLGPLIHNPIVVADLEARGIHAADTPAEAGEGSLIIRAHGVTPAVIDEAREAGLDVVDATCPYVKRVHHAAEKLAREGYQVLVVGESGHPEVQGIMGPAGEGARVVSDDTDLDALELKPQVGVVVQTTQTAARLSEVVAALAPRVQELRVVNTICEATAERQRAAAALAAASDCMIVVGGRQSGNTRRLAQICRDGCPNTHHIEDASELDPAWFANAESIGITAGASTPAAHIDRVVARLKELSA